MAESSSVPGLTCVVLVSPGRCSDAGAGGFPLKLTAKRNTTTRTSAEGPILSPVEIAHSWSCSGGSLASLGPKFLLFPAVLPARGPQPHGAGVGWERGNAVLGWQVHGYQGPRGQQGSLAGSLHLFSYALFMFWVGVSPPRAEQLADKGDRGSQTPLHGGAGTQPPAGAAPPVHPMRAG